MKTLAKYNKFFVAAAGFAAQLITVGGWQDTGWAQFVEAVITAGVVWLVPNKA